MPFTLWFRPSDSILLAPDSDSRGARRGSGEAPRRRIRRTNADKRQAVERLLNDEKWSKWSNVRIANQCSVSESLVRSVAEELSSFKTKIRTVTRNGTTYQQDTSNIGVRAVLGRF